MVPYKHKNDNELDGKKNFRFKFSLLINSIILNILCGHFCHHFSS